MTLSEAYRERIARLASYVAAADISNDADERMRLNACARRSQREADYIAHCVAYFGDTEVEALIGAEALKRARELPCRLENPWARGLDLLRQDFPAR